MNSCEEVAGGLVVSGGNSPELLELCEEVFDQVPGFVEVSVKVAGMDAVRPWRDHSGFARGAQWVENPYVGIERFVGDQRVGLHDRDQMVSPYQVVSFPSAQKEADRIAERIDHGVDFRAQPAAGSSDGLVSVFFWAPALC